MLNRDQPCLTEGLVMAWMGFKWYVFLIRGIYMHVLPIEHLKK